MSSRQLRKLQQQREREKVSGAAAHKSEDSDEDFGEKVPAGGPRPNPFAALGGEDEDGGDGHDDGDGQDEGDGTTPDDGDLSHTVPTPAGNKSKKKRQKKKKKAKTPAGDADGADEDEDEIDKAMKELKVAAPNDEASSTLEPHDRSRSRMSELLSVNTHNLRALNEMRSLFGRDVIESADAEGQHEGNRRRRAPVQTQVDLETFLREPPGAPKLPEVSLRRNVFVQGRDHWPRQSAGGLTMREVAKAPDGSWTEYAYVHDKNYDGMQVLFFACVQTGDAMRMVHLLKRVPYHVSTLLQVSSVAQQDQNMALAAELCERALFTFGRVATFSFRQSIEKGRARLDFRRPENRQFWLAGYHYLKSLIRKGTYRTALEWAKLLYALDPKDPFAMRHFIHVLAVRAHESRWLIEWMGEMDRCCDDRDLDYPRQSLVLAKLQMGDVEGARGDAGRGMQRLPWLYCAMFSELNLDAPQSIWGISASSDPRRFWVRLYLYQTKELWDNAQASSLLQEVAGSLGRVDAATLPDDAPPDLGATRLAYLEGQTWLLAVAPKAILNSQPNYDFDPLPPAKAENVFTGEGTRLPWDEGRLQNQGHSPELLAQMRDLIAGQAGPAAQGAFFHDDEDDDDDEMRALRQADDEELQRDLEAHLGQADGPGLLGMVMRILGIGQDGASRVGGESEAPAAADEAEGLPGAWPAEDGQD